MPAKGQVKPKPAIYSGTEQEWKALTPIQRCHIRYAVEKAVWQKAYKKEHYKKVTENAKNYALVNADKIKTRNTKYATENRDKTNARNKKYREENRDKVNAGGLVYYHANSQAISIQNQQRRIKKNKEFREMFGDDGIQP